MNNNNPFIPQGSLLDQKNRKRARVKVAVYSIFALNLLIIIPLLIQGCGNKQAAPDAGNPPADTGAAATPPVDTTPAPPTLPTPSNGVPATAATSNVPVIPVTPPPPPPVVETPTTKEYVVAKGDSYYSIAKKFGVKMKEVESANPTIPATKLKVGQKIQIPASAGSGTSTTSTGTDTGGMETYTVKSGDSLSKIAKQFSVTIKALRAANDMKTDKIKVGDKLKVPGKAPAPDITPAPTPAPIPAPAPSVPTPAPATATPGH
jgi:LysM repeat protein